MLLLRRLSYAALAVAGTHLVFGAIVRISGSGMGCGDHWPTCYGRWFPPLTRPDLLIEWTHRLLASVLLVSLLALVAASWRSRAEPGVAGRGGVLRAAGTGLALAVGAAILGAVTVKLGNAPAATVAHWVLAMTLLAVLATAAMRAGAFGRAQSATPAQHTHSRQHTARAAYAAAAMAFLAVALGSFTANYPGAAVACTGFPLCGRNPEVAMAGVAMQLAHRAIAFLLFLHLLGVGLRARRRGNARPVVRAARASFALVTLQLVVAAAMVLGHLPPVLRSVHEAVGVSVWLATFVFAYLARSQLQEAASPLEDGSRSDSDDVPASLVPSPVSLGHASGTASLPPTIAVIVARGAEHL